MRVRRGFERDHGSPLSPVLSAAAQAVIELERTHGTILATFVTRLGIERAIGDEVAQEALLRLYRELDGGAEIADPRAWTFRVAYRLGIDELRRKSRERRWVEQARVPANEAGTDDDIARREVWEMVDSLPERQRDVIYLRYRADLKYAAIASVLGITASAARSHATQAIASLRTIAAAREEVAG
jgi:RNA polymerase sigma-70 factor (ECF subfamily)